MECGGKVNDFFVILWYTVVVFDQKPNQQDFCASQLKRIVQTTKKFTTLLFNIVVSRTSKASQSYWTIV